MSQEDVEMARRGFEAFNRTLAEVTPDFFETLDPEVEWIPVTSVLEGTTFRGPERVRKWIEDMQRDWTEYEARPEHFRDLGDGRVLVLGSWRARGRTVDAPLDFPQAAWLLEYRKGKLVRLESFTERDKALEAVGLRE